MEKKKEHPCFYRRAIKIIFLCPCTYLYEAGFPSCASTKTNYSRMKAEADKRIKLPLIKPDVEEIWKKTK